MIQNSSGKRHVSLNVKKESKQQSPPLVVRDIYSSKHSMDYVTVEGIKLRTGYHDMKDWYLLVIKELLDNSVDFLWKKYQGASDALIDVHIEKTNDKLFHMKVRNTNSKNFEVFRDQDLKAIFDYDMRYGSKQHVRIISRGMLGDAMKQVLALPYVLIHTNDDGTAFTDRQWEHPLIIRCNKRERRIYLTVDKANQTITARIDESDKELPFTDTEIEVTLHVVDDIANDLTIGLVEQFCKEYPTFTTDISFEFKLADYTPDEPRESDQQEQSRALSSLSSDEKERVVTELAKAISSPPRKATIKINYPALHPISKTWINTASIATYKPAEFMAFIEGVFDKENTTVDERLRQLSEGTQMKKNPDNDISIAELIAGPNKTKRVEELYYELKDVFRKKSDKTKKLSLPYTTNPGKRKAVLVKRIAELYTDQLDTESAVYKLKHDRYQDEYDILNYPYVFEIVAVPFNNDVIQAARYQWERKQSEFKGSVNYSISPRGNNFEAKYDWVEDEDEDFDHIKAGNIQGLLEGNGFSVISDEATVKTKLPCVIFANLVTQRPDYHGHDKSRIDTEPFKPAIMAAVKELVRDIPTYRAAGWTLPPRRAKSRHRWRGSYTPVKEKKRTIRDVVIEVLKTRGLPDIE